MGLRSTPLQRRDAVAFVHLRVVLPQRLLLVAWWGGGVLGGVPGAVRQLEAETAAVRGAVEIPRQVKLMIDVEVGIVAPAYEGKVLIRAMGISKCFPENLRVRCRFCGGRFCCGSIRLFPRVLGAREGVRTKPKGKA